MKRAPQCLAPDDADDRKAIKPVICYPVETLPPPDMAVYATAREAMELTETVIVPPGMPEPFTSLLEISYGSSVSMVPRWAI